MAKYTHTTEKEHRENKLCVEVPMCHRPAVTGLHPFWINGFQSWPVCHVFGCTDLIPWHQPYWHHAHFLSDVGIQIKNHWLKNIAYILSKAVQLLTVWRQCKSFLKFALTLLSTAGMRSRLCPTVPCFLKPTQTSMVLRQLRLIFVQYKYRRQLSSVQHGVIVESMSSSATTKGNTLAISCGPCSEKERSSPTGQRGWVSDTIFPPKPCMPYHLKPSFATT